MVGRLYVFGNMKFAKSLINVLHESRKRLDSGWFSLGWHSKDYILAFNEATKELAEEDGVLISLGRKDEEAVTTR